MEKLKNLISKNSRKRKRTLLVVLVLACAVAMIAPMFCQAADSTMVNNPNPTTNYSGSTGWFSLFFGYLLYSVVWVMGSLVSAAATLFQFIIAPENISGSNGILNKQAIKDIWIMVRDILNMTFILVLLFSAFCTIFQVEKWNLKKVWLNILINALLVNFSYSIARFIIDISNVAMYYLVNSMFTATSGSVGGQKIMADIASTEKLGQILMPSNFASAPLSYEIAMIVFLFILGVTLMVIAILFVVRIIALAMLIMFSPIGFVGFIFPETRGYAENWWKQLFSYSFFAPIMIFMMAIALQVMRAIGDENYNSLLVAASTNSPDDQGGFIASAAWFCVPIIILWFGMGIAKSMGIAGADLVVGKAQGFAKWAGMKMSGAAFVRDTYQSYRARRDKAKGDRWSARFGNYLGNKQDQLRGTIPGYTGDHARNRYQSEEAAKVAEEAKLRDTANATEGELVNLARTGNKYAQAAANLELANRGRTNGANELNAVREAFGETSQVFRQMQNKVKTYDPAAAFAHLAPADRQARLTEHVNSNQFDPKKLNAASLGNAEFLGIAMEQGCLKPEDLNELAKKSNDHSRNIQSSLNTITNEPLRDATGNPLLDLAGNPIPAHQNMNNENDRNIHIAYTASTGRVHASLDSNQRREVFSRLDKDNARNLDANEIRNYSGEIIRNVNSGRFKDIVSNMRNNESKRALVQEIMNVPAPPPPQALVLQRQIRRDPYLASFI